MACMSYEDLVALVRSRMDELSLKQNQLATRSGISPSQISRILKLESVPSQDAIKSIAHALRIDPELAFRTAGILDKRPSCQFPCGSLATLNLIRQIIHTYGTLAARVRKRGL
jgi:transcriptional regulator with XRE-family HTH domain